MAKRKQMTVSFQSQMKNFAVHTLGIEKTILWILVNRTWNLIRGPISIFFIVNYLSPESQGIWYTFISLGALTIFAELGFTRIITQFVSHEYARLRLRNGFIVGKRNDVDRLFSLIRYAIKFYLVVIPFATVILSVCGYYFFSDQPHYVLIAWSVFSIIGGLNLFCSLLQSIYQGLDRIKDIQKNILIGSLFMPIFNWTLLYFKFQIWALVLGNGIGMIVMLSLLFKHAPRFWSQVLRYKINRHYSWFKEIVCLQWKYAVSWISGYFIFHLYIPAVYKYEDSIIAGQLGLTFSIIYALKGMAGAWMESKIPKFNILVAKNQRKELLSLFLRSSFQSYITTIVGSLCFILIIHILNSYHLYHNRFLDIRLTSLFLLSELAISKIGFLAVYLRSHKAEPFYFLSIINGALIGSAIFYILPTYGLIGLSMATIIIYWLIIFPLSLIIFFKFKTVYEREHYEK